MLYFCHAFLPYLNILLRCSTLFPQNPPSVILVNFLLNTPWFSDIFLRCRNQHCTQLFRSGCSSDFFNLFFLYHLFLIHFNILLLLRAATLNRGVQFAVHVCSFLSVSCEKLCQAGLNKWCLLVLLWPLQ